MIKFFIRRILSAQQATAGLHIRGAHIIDCVVFDMCSQRYLKKKPSGLICRDIHYIIRQYLDLIEKNKHYLQKGPKNTAYLWCVAFVCIRRKTTCDSLMIFGVI